MKQDLLRIFIGYDSRQPVAFQVAAHSIWRHASRFVCIAPLRLECLPITRKGLTEFTYSRFLVPYLSNFEGQSLFVDSDTICLGDVFELLALSVGYPETSVFVVQGQLRFEWPSVMLFNNDQCKVLTPEYVEDQSHGLFNLEWAKTIGNLPRGWNHLIGYDTPNPKAKLIHFTQGIPVWPETKDTEFAQQWWDEFKTMNSTVSFDELMGRSVHAKPVYERLKRTAKV